MINFKKILALVLSITMVLGLGVAAWAADLTLTYDANGGTAAPEANTAGATKTLTTSGANHANDADGNAIVIIGWTETADTTIYQAGDTLSADYYYANGAEITLDENTTVYALWGLDTNGNGTADVVEEGTAINVTYDANGGAGAPEAVKTVAGSYKISTTVPTKDVKKFMGWTTTATPADIDKDKQPEASFNLVADAKAAGATVELSADTTYYALWADDANDNDTADYEDTLYTIAYDMNTTPGVGFDGIVRPVTTSGSLTDGTTYAENTIGDISAKVPSATTATIYDEVKDETVNLAFIGWSDVQNPKAVRAGDSYTTINSITFTTAGLSTYTVSADKVVTVYAVWSEDADNDGKADAVEEGVPVGTGKDTIKITQNPASGTAGTETYTAYKIFDVTKLDTVTEPVTGPVGPGTDTGFSYTIKSDSPWLSLLNGTWTDEVDSETGTTTKKFTPNNTEQVWVALTPTADGNYNVTWVGDNNEAAAKDFAAWLLANKPGNAESETFTTGQTLHTAPGYYLITSSLGSNLILATTNIDLQTKNKYPSTEKTTPEDNSYAVGDKVPFTITVTLPTTVDYTKTVTIHDTMDEHLKFYSNSIKITKIDGEDVGTSPAVTGALTAPGSDGCTFDYVLTISGLAPATCVDPVEHTITVEYEAELLHTDDETVVAAGKTYVNSEYIEYSGYKTPESEAEVETKEWTLIKQFDGVAKDDFEATFILVTDTSDESTAVHFVMDGDKYVKADDSEYTPVDGDTIITVKGTTEGVKLVGFAKDDETTYYLIEKSTADGYNMITEPTPVVINGDNVTITVNNQSGTELPSTGGIGTTIFYIVGGLLAVGAGVVLVSKKRMGKVDDYSNPHI